ncbi:MAG: M28 family peptidase [Sphingobium sp.]|uniref:M28 family peptidase n=1 Tax=Sphingobium sp. TaxID=1912891 RepID=UPI000C3EBAFC|nr:M28 family peptidase [Sphingobium sp.]MBU0658040.1 M28 family peptidase [Alphaproteobacteria bacterium]MBA4754649.1 M28 family peptidase [Sphingobium sp.]MBS87955.1 peptidase M28 [Sphingobium sp.]MBU0774733.1 M28 family peptidase [Alphaproteobacteria bacterium]MBU0869568.1 M28 family peptidase [Alphaproteobacteria bacterium]
MRTSLPALATALALPLAACSSAGADAPPASASATTPAAVEPSIDTMKRLVQELSSDAYEGRAPGSAGEEKTLALLAAEFGKLGLKPGNKGSWFQDVPLVEITAKNVSPLSFTGGKNPVSTTYGPEMVIGTYRTTQPKIAVKDSPVVFVGYGINAPEKGWNDYAGVDVKGKTVIILVNDPDYETPGLTGPFNGRAMTYYGRWTYKYEEAARQGAAAAIIVHDTVPAAYGWNVVQSSWTGAQHVADSADGNAGLSAAIGWIQKDKAKALFASAGMDLDAQMAAARKPGFKAVPLGAVKASVSFDNDLRKHMSKNVVALLPGKTRPDEYVLYSAHWDHLGHCQAAPDGDDICNGAVDNATGTAALVALAEANVKAGPTDRSQVFLAVTAEESGLLGSAYYGSNPVFPFAQTVGGVNMDALSVAGLAKNVVVIGKGKSQLDAYLDRALAAQDRVATLEPTPEKGYYYRSDHFSFAKHGLPMLYFEGGEDLVNGGTAAGNAAAEDYTKNRYHGPKDEYDPNWDWTGVLADLKLYYNVGRDLATGSDWPNWVEGDEFRAIRDKDRAGK